MITIHLVYMSAVLMFWGFWGIVWAAVKDLPVDICKWSSKLSGLTCTSASVSSTLCKLFSMTRGGKSWDSCLFSPRSLIFPWKGDRPKALTSALRSEEMSSEDTQEQSDSQLNTAAYERSPPSSMFNQDGRCCFTWRLRGKDVVLFVKHISFCFSTRPHEKG